MVSTRCATGYYSFAHEIGHNFRLLHDRGTENNCNNVGFNFGYRDPGAAFRSILAYDCVRRQCDNMPKVGCPRVQMFSNTQNLYKGKAIGNQFNDNARQWNNVRAAVASYYPAMNCIRNSQCNDNNILTVDTCDVEKAVCVFTSRRPFFWRRLRSILRGDPHITTLDGLEFDCQARGEFIFLKSFNSSFQIQGRFTEASATSFGSTASVTTALVVQETLSEEESGVPIIQISFDGGNATSSTVQGCLDLVKFYEDGIARSLKDGAIAATVSVSVVDPDEIILLFSTGLEIHIFVKASPSFGCFFTQLIDLPEGYRSDETLAGLLGNADGDPFDDWQTEDGLALPTPDNTSTAFFQASYDYCRTEWCIRESFYSLFTYSNSTSFNSYFKCNTPYEPALENAVNDASPELSNLCGTDVQCLIDGTAGSMMDAQSYVNETIRLIALATNNTAPTTAPSRSPTKSPTQTLSRNPTQAPAKVASKIPTKTPTKAPTNCGLFRLNIFCPRKGKCGFFKRLLKIGKC